MNRVVRFMLLLAMAGAVTAPARAADGIEADQSSLSAVIRQLGVSVEGDFRRFDGQLTFDPAQPEAASARLVIDTASFDLGMRDFNAEVAKPEWLDVGKHPEAVFSASGLTPTGEGQYQLSGTLTLKGQQGSVKTTVKMTEADGRRRFEGEWPLSRKTFGIGGSSWDGVVEDTVRVRFSIVQKLTHE